MVKVLKEIAMSVLMLKQIKNLLLRYIDIYILDITSIG